jgi:WD40 repeat protein
MEQRGFVRLSECQSHSEVSSQCQDQRNEATADERFLLVACANGEIGVWNIGTGDKLWWHTPSQSGLGYIYDASFSWDCRTLVACNDSDFAVVFDTLTGKQIGKISFPLMQTNIMSVTLAPDGSSGALVDLGQQLFTFDVRTGLMKDTGVKGG